MPLREVPVDERYKSYKDYARVATPYAVAYREQGGQFDKDVYKRQIHRRDEFRADRLVVDHALANPKIVPVMDSVLESIEGSDMVEKIVVRNVKTNELRQIELSGVFIFIGTLPNAEYLHGLLQTDAAGWIITCLLYTSYCTAGQKPTGPDADGNVGRHAFVRRLEMST